MLVKMSIWPTALEHPWVFATVIQIFHNRGHMDFKHLPNNLNFSRCYGSRCNGWLFNKYWKEKDKERHFLFWGGKWMGIISVKVVRNLLSLQRVYCVIIGLYPPWMGFFFVLRCIKRKHLTRTFCWPFLQDCKDYTNLQTVCIHMWV